MSRRIPLSRGKFALVSDEDHERVSQFKWSYDKGYACRKVTWRDAEGVKHQRKLLLHRFIMGEPAGMDVDHANHLRLDCRRCNLRVATRAQNNANSGPKTGSYKGVYARGDRWRAEICVNGRTLHLGTHRDPREAARHYDIHAYKAWGQFAFLNFPDEVHATTSIQSTPQRNPL